MSKEFYRDIQLTLAAGDIIPIFAYGKFLRVLSNSIATDPLVSINNQASQPIPSGVGIDLPQKDVADGEESFTRLDIKNPHSSSTMTLRIAISNGVIDDARFSASGTISVSDGGGSLTVDNANIDEIANQLKGDATAKGFNEVSISNSTATLVVAANTSRKSTILQAKYTNTDVMYLGYDNTVATNKYFLILQAGQSYSCDDYQGAIYALASVNNEKISYGEV